MGFGTVWALIKGQIMYQCCGTCKYWNSENGDCIAPILFPDSTYSRSEGFRKKMREEDGNKCPTYKSK